MDKESFKHYMIGVKEIDDEHLVLLELMEKISLCAVGDKECIKRITNDIYEQTVIHGTHEEAFMEKINYPYITYHKQEHASILTRLRKLKHNRVIHMPQRFLMESIREAVLGHIDKYDMQIGDFYKGVCNENNRLVSFTSGQN